ncbi:MAG: hypothetical protein WA705_03465 [Candidatus Ozemobacteraceae bacterium]
MNWVETGGMVKCPFYAGRIVALPILGRGDRKRLKKKYHRLSLEGLGKNWFCFVSRSAMIEPFWRGCYESKEHCLGFYFYNSCNIFANRHCGGNAYHSKPPSGKSTATSEGPTESVDRNPSRESVKNGSLTRFFLFFLELRASAPQLTITSFSIC